MFYRLAVHDDVIWAEGWCARRGTVLIYGWVIVIGKTDEVVEQRKDGKSRYDHYLTTGLNKNSNSLLFVVKVDRGERVVGNRFGFEV
jgi:hypothetical protein